MTSEATKSEMILSVPGPWKERGDFVRAVVSATGGEFIFAGAILASPRGNDHVPLDFVPYDSQMRNAFEIAGHGKLSTALLDQISRHGGVAYVHFPIGIIGQKERVARFTEVLKLSGGLAVKVESAGVAHEWNHWLAALRSENPFDLYRTFVVLVGDSQHYYSCGMHHFGLPDVEVERSLEISQAADLMNRFNYWQIVEEPKIAAGHTFSITADAPRCRIAQKNDSRHDPADLFHNPHGLWSLKRVV
jgi:hypothetical protein